MAIIFPGKSKCAICGGILTESDELFGLPPISDILNPLYKYFDAAFHKTCFENWDKEKEIQQILKNEN